MTKPGACVLALTVLLASSCDLGSRAVAFDQKRPALVSPQDKSVFDLYPRTTTLSWQEVEGATSYVVHAEYTWTGDFTQFGEWGAGDFDVALERETAGTSVTFDFVGAQPGRWKVMGKSADAQTLWSDWWYFRYTQ